MAGTGPSPKPRECCGALPGEYHRGCCSKNHQGPWHKTKRACAEGRCPRCARFRVVKLSEIMAHPRKSLDPKDYL